MIDDALAKLVARAVRDELGDELSALRAEIVALRREVQALRGSAGRKGEAHAGRKSRGAEQSASSPAPSAKAIRALREKLGLTQAAFAKLAGVSSVAVYFWETGRTTPRGRTVDALADVAALSPERAQQRLSSGDLPTRRTRTANSTPATSAAKGNGRRTKRPRA